MAGKLVQQLVMWYKWSYGGFSPFASSPGWRAVSHWRGSFWGCPDMKC